MSSKKDNAENTKAKNINFGSLDAEVEKARGAIPFATFVKLAIQEKLARDKATIEALQKTIGGW